MQYEAIEQEYLFQWAEAQSAKKPELKLLFHVPNGGRRDAVEAAHLKRQGVKAGVPDLWLPVARGKFHGLVIELKYGGNKMTIPQRLWLKALKNQGYCACLCYGWEQAAKCIESYLGGGIAHD